MRILITGASGLVAQKLRPGLRSRRHELVLVDIIEPAPAAEAGETYIEASINDAERLERALAGVDLVVHLAAFSGERGWERMVELNITGSRTVLESARRVGVHRVLLASSIHAVGMLDVAASRSQVEPAPHPDTYYGVSKAAAEALGRLYGARFGMTVVAARIGTVLDEPDSPRALSTWISPADFVRLVEACLTTTASGGHVVWAVSNNTRSVVSLEAGRAIGYHPEDDAESYAAALGDPDPLAESTLLAGAFADEDHPVGEDW